MYKIENICADRKAKQQLRKALESGRISHAQMFAGPGGSGALELASAFAAELLGSESLLHPDLHFVFPTSGNRQGLSEDYMAEFRRFIDKKPYGSLVDWYEMINLENKQGVISVGEAEAIQKKLQLKSYSGGYKALIIWHAEKLNPATANKLLKLIEEPGEKTLIILTTDFSSDILPTILSRVQQIELSPVSAEEISSFLQKNYNMEAVRAEQIARASQGDVGKAISLARGENLNLKFEELFVRWIRAAFMAKKNPSMLNELIILAEELDRLGREKQKQLILFSQEYFRQAMLEQYCGSLRTQQPAIGSFNFEAFSGYVHGNNIGQINDLLNEAHLHLVRNGSAKIVFLDTSIKITRLLHRSAY